MDALIRKISRAFTPREKRVAESKREMEKRLRAGGLSITEAKKAVAAAFSSKVE